MKLDIVIPTWKRPEKTARCVESIYNSITTHEFRIIVIPDIKRRRAFGIWNRYLQCTNSDTYDAMAYVCDDVTFYPETIEIALNVFETLYPDLDGVIGLNRHNTPRGKEGWSVGGMGIIGEGFVANFPRRDCFCPDYTTFHADSELRMFADSIGKFTFCEEAHIFHDHPTYYPDAMDETHEIVREPGIVDMDRKTWETRRQLKLLWGRSFELVRGKDA